MFGLGLTSGFFGGSGLLEELGTLKFCGDTGPGLLGVVVGGSFAGGRLAGDGLAATSVDERKEKNIIIIIIID